MTYPAWQDVLESGKSLLRGTGAWRGAQVSVIVPVFNKAAHLADCLESVRNQSLRRIEILCVDDCSTDESAAIVERHARADGRVRLLRMTRNGGPGASRNFGLRKARADFVFFLDADDLLPADSLQTLWQLAASTGSPLVRGSLANCSAQRPGIWTTGEGGAPDRRNFRLLDEPALWLPYFFVCYLYSRRLLAANRITFPELRAGEDPVFLAASLVAADSISATSDLCYIYRRDGSLAQRRNTSSHLKDFVEHAALVKGIYLSSGHERCWWDKCERFLFDDVLLLMSQVDLTEAERGTIVQSLRRIWPEYSSELDFAAAGNSLALK
jgi:glycosyltransferase involved in cell wall biosynthesis